MTTQDHELSAALGWPGGISDPVLDRTRLLQMVAALRLASKQALEALEGSAGILQHEHVWPGAEKKSRFVIAALRTALAQQVEPVEPVACPSCEELGYVPLSEDGRSVFIDGAGEVPLAQWAEPVEPVATLTAQRNVLLEALKLALSSHGVMLMSDPPQDAWKVNRVEERGCAAIKAVEEGK